MNRSAFARSIGAAAAGALVSGTPRLARAETPSLGVVEGRRLTQAELFATLPRAASHEWTRIILGSGVAYQKQIGAGVEVAANGSRLLYYELQVGSPGGSCNPSTMRKAYLKQTAFGSLLDDYALLSNIGRTENLVFRYGDVTDAAKSRRADTTLRLLDEDYLYDPRPLRVVSVATERIHVASRNLDATHVVAEYAPAGACSRHRLQRVELWHSPLFPFGLAKYRATVAGIDPFEMHVYAHGDDFKSLLSMPLDRVRAITKDGAYGQLDSGIGA